MNSWQAGQDGRVGQKTGDRRQKTEDRMRFGDEFPACRDIAAFRLCFDVDFDIDYLLPMGRDLQYFVRCILYIM